MAQLNCLFGDLPSRELGEASDSSVAVATFRFPLLNSRARPAIRHRFAGAMSANRLCGCIFIQYAFPVRPHL